MSRPAILRPAADGDIQATHDQLEQVQAGLGDRFLAGRREILENIEAMPGWYGVVSQDVREVRLKKFRHVVSYAVFAGRERYWLYCMVRGTLRRGSQGYDRAVARPG